MFWKDIGYLCNETQNLDKLKRPKKGYTERKVYCDIRSIRQSEFYQARAEGFKPEIMVVMKNAEYKNENHFKYKDKLYRVARTYIKGDIIEITCTSTVTDNE